MAQLAFIGLGRMGLPMALKLVAQGHAVLGWDCSPAATAEFCRKGGRAAEARGEAARGAEAVLLCLPDVTAVDETMRGPDGVLARLSPGALVVDHTSMSVEDARRLAREARSARGARWVDAPVSGGPARAEGVGLVAWLGGAPKAAQAARTLLEAYCATAWVMGGPGSGQLAKSCNQLIVTAMIAAWAEALRLSEGAGLPPRRLLEVLQGASADFPPMRAFAQTLVEGRFPVRSLANFTKDLGVIVGLAEAHGIDVPVARGAILDFERIRGRGREPVPGAGWIPIKTRRHRSGCDQGGRYDEVNENIWQHVGQTLCFAHAPRGLRPCAGRPGLRYGRRPTRSDFGPGISGRRAPRKPHPGGSRWRGHRHCPEAD